MAPYTNGYSSAFRKSHSDDSSIVDELRAIAANMLRSLWRFFKGHGRIMAMNALIRASHQLRRNLTARRLLSFPHMLVGLWLLVLLWGERWVFSTKVDQCRWEKWENWPAGATPHRLVLVADPQLIDPHSYPGRPWPINPLTYHITDNYLRRSYNQLVEKLDPTTIFFLGDLFDGGREWKTDKGDFNDPEWGHRPGFEKTLLNKWHKKYSQNFWLREYERFGNIFLDPWRKAAASKPLEDQRGRKLIASLPGNHDLGFADEIKLPVRDRFQTYFGEGNRIDVIGNHTFVSVDSVSLSGDTAYHRIEAIYKPTEHFLKQVGWAKRKAVVKELRHQRGEPEEIQFRHRIEDLARADFTDSPKYVTGEGGADFPSILLTHVPLYRPPGTPCGPLREHWPPAKPPKGQQGPVIPDHRNAISVSGGYQYQNVLSEQDSVDIIRSIGNVVHAFSGDDHDYCELKHDAQQDDVPEITVKSISMAMGVPTPGFVMVSLYNPIDAEGRPLPGAPKTTLQTHLCLLPNQLRTFAKYGVFAFISVLLLGVRAFLVPALGLTPFALEPMARGRGGALLPMNKAKSGDDDHGGRAPTDSGTSGFSASSTFASPQPRQAGGYGYGLPAGSSGKLRHSSSSSGHRHAKAGGGGGGKWGWGANSVGRTPKIEIRPDDDEDDDYPVGYGGGGGGGKWKAARARGGRLRPSSLAVIGRELWTTGWRALWMVACIWLWLTWTG